MLPQSYTTYDIESGYASRIESVKTSLTSFKNEFIEFKQKMEKEIYEIRQKTHPDCCESCCRSIFELGYVASYIILWLIVFHKM